MAVDVVPPSAPENKAVSAVRGIPSFYQAVMAEMRKVTWPLLGFLLVEHGSDELLRDLFKMRRLHRVARTAFGK